MLKFCMPEGTIDIVGTGGDQAGTWNVSTLAAIIAAACGVTVAKHGNRAASSLSGAADVLTALGVKYGLPKNGVEACLSEAGLGFMFAQTHHAAMRHVAAVRVELGTRTIFNLLGPQTNPAGVKRQVLGVFAEGWQQPIAETLRNLGSDYVWVVHGTDGLDELTTTGPSRVVCLDHGRISAFMVTPEEAGLPRATMEELKGGDPQTNAAALRAVLGGEKTAYRHIAVLNAAAGLVVAGKADSLKEGAEQAAAAIESGAARAKLEKLVAVSNRF